LFELASTADQRLYGFFGIFNCGPTVWNSLLMKSEIQRVVWTSFTARQNSLLAIDSVRPSVWPSDGLSHAGIMPIPLQLRSWGLHWKITPWLYI